MFEGDGSDKFCGRTVCGLPLYKREFTCLPPQFDANLTISGDEWKVIHSEYDSMPLSFRQCLPFLLVSLVYHKDWLHANLVPEHPLFSISLFTTGKINTFSNNVILGNNECTSTGMRATGIPPYIGLMEAMHGIVVNMKEQCLQVTSCFDNIKDTFLGWFLSILVAVVVYLISKVPLK